MAGAADVRRIAFSIDWEGPLLASLVAVVGLGAIGIAVGVVGVPMEFPNLHPSIAATLVFAAVGLLCGFAAFNYVIARTIGVQFGQYRLELVKGPELSGGI